LCTGGLEIGRFREKPDPNPDRWQIEKSNSMGAGMKEKMVSLRDRDKRLLRLCYEQQFLLSDVVADHFFTSYGEASRRLKELKDAGLLETMRAPTNYKRWVYRLSRKGAALASELSDTKLSLHWDPLYLEHDATVTAVRLQLEKLWDGLWVPERAIRGYRPREVPDGLFVFPNGAKVAIEVENSLKGRARFEARLLRWKDIDVKIVLYVATKPEIFDRLRVFLEGASRPPLFCLVQLSELWRPQPEVWSPLGEIDLFSERTL
jgi:DNA-binding MarR family transcriptional regulator